MSGLDGVNKETPIISEIILTLIKSFFLFLFLFTHIRRKPNEAYLNNRVNHENLELSQFFKNWTDQTKKQKKKTKTKKKKNIFTAYFASAPGK